MATKEMSKIVADLIQHIDEFRPHEQKQIREAGTAIEDGGIIPTSEEWELKGLHERI